MILQQCAVRSLQSDTLVKGLLVSETNELKKPLYKSSDPVTKVIFACVAQMNVVT